MSEYAINTRFGSLQVAEENGAITRLCWSDVSAAAPGPLLQEAARQIEAYCAGRLFAFDLPLKVSGGPLQQAVCDAMRAIPFGETRSYGQIARLVGASAQAVGQACAKNPIPVIIPCHRVMGADGKLVGFSGAGGVETKVALLRHECAGSFLI